MIKTIQIAAVSVVMLILSACSNPVAVRTESGLKLNLDAQEKEGYVILKVVTLRPISLLSPHWKSISVTSNGNRSELNNVLQPYNMLMGRHIPTESLYFAKLNAGEYDITGLDSIGADGMGVLIAILSSDHASVKQKLHFKVEAGHLANLGTIVFNPKLEESPEQLFLLNGPAGKKSALDTLLYETQQSGFPLSQSGGWDNDSSLESENELLNAARQHVSLLTFTKSINELKAGSNLGQIFSRTGPQSWTSESVNTLSRIYSIGKTTDGRTIAGSDSGEYFVQSNHGAWSTLRIQQEVGRIIHVEHRADGSAIFIAGDLLKTRVWFKKSLEDTSEKPTELAKLDGPPDNLLNADDELILAANIPGLNREVTISRINKKTLEVSSKKENFWMIDWQTMEDGSVNVTRMNGMSTYPSTWENNRTKWVHDDKSNGVLTYWIDKKNGISIKASAGFTMVTNQLQTTSDGGKTWVKMGNAIDTRDFAGRIIYADESEVILVGSNMVYSTKDKGQSWQRIFPQRVAH